MALFSTDTTLINDCKLALDNNDKKLRKRYEYLVIRQLCNRN